MLSKLRPVSDNIFRKILPQVKRLGISPNGYTFLGLISGITASIMILEYRFIYGAFFLILAGIFDLMDGALARYLSPKPFGRIFDTLTDKYVEGILIIAIVSVMPYIYIESYLWGALLILGSISISLVSNIGKSITDKKVFKLFDRGSRIGVIFLSLILARNYPYALSFAVVLLTVGSHLTVLILMARYYMLSKGLTHH